MNSESLDNSVNASSESSQKSTLQKREKEDKVVEKRAIFRALKTIT